MSKHIALRQLFPLLTAVFTFAVALPVEVTTAQDRPFIPLDHPNYAEISPAAGPHFERKAHTKHHTALRGAKERARQKKTAELIQQKEAEQHEKNKILF